MLVSHVPRHARGMVNGRDSRGLGNEADGGIGSPEALVGASRDDLKEEPLIKRMGVNLEEFTLAFAAVHNLVVAKRRHIYRIAIVFGFDIVVIIVWNFEESAPRARMSATVAKISVHEKAMCRTPEPKNSLLKRAESVRVADEPFRITRRLWC